MPQTGHLDISLGSQAPDFSWDLFPTLWQANVLSLCTEQLLLSAHLVQESEKLKEDPGMMRQL